MARLATPGSEVFRLTGLLEDDDKGNPVSAAFGSGIITTGQQAIPDPFYAYTPRERERFSSFGGFATSTNPGGLQPVVPVDTSQNETDSGFTGQTAGTFVGSNLGLPEYNVNIPGYGETDIIGTATNLAIDQGLGALGLNPMPGVGVLSTLINPTIIPAEEVPWGTEFNTGGGGLIGAAGKISYENLVDIYEKTQAGEEGYQFYPPGKLPGQTSPIGISPGMFGFGSVVSGNTDLLPPQADINKDGQITASEVQQFDDPDSKERQDYLDIQENKTQAQQEYEDYIQSQQESGGSGFVGGTVVTDSKGEAVTSLDAQGNETPVTSGGTFTNFGALPEEPTENIFPDFVSSVTPEMMDALTAGVDAGPTPMPEGTYQIATNIDPTTVVDASFTNEAQSDDKPSGNQYGGFDSGTVQEEMQQQQEAYEEAAFEPPAPSRPASDNQKDQGGDSGGGKIVCTEMYRQTQLDDWAKAMKIWDIYQKRHLTPLHEVGYHWLFKPYVKGMQKSNSMTRLGAFLARERTQHLKYVLTKGRAKDSLIGNVWCKIIHPIVYVAGKIKKGESNG